MSGDWGSIHDPPVVQDELLWFSWDHFYTSYARPTSRPNLLYNFNNFCRIDVFSCLFTTEFTRGDYIVILVSVNTTKFIYD